MSVEKVREHAREVATEVGTRFLEGALRDAEAIYAWAVTNGNAAAVAFLTGLTGALREELDKRRV